MAKFNMKDYENFIEEEARQDRLQEELEDRREMESYSYGSDVDWYAYQQKQKEENEPYEYDDYYDYWPDDFDDDEYQDDDCYYPECEDDSYGPEYDPYDLLDYGVPGCGAEQSFERLQIESELDLMEANLRALGICDASNQCIAGYYNSDSSLTAEDLYDMYTYAQTYVPEGYCESETIDPLEEELLAGVQEFDEDTVAEELICRKAVAINLRYSSEKSKKRTKMIAAIIKEQYHISRKKNRKNRKRLKKLLKKVS